MPTTILIQDLQKLGLSDKEAKAIFLKKVLSPHLSDCGLYVSSRSNGEI